MRELVATGSRFKSTTDTAQFFFYLINSKTFYQFWNGKKISWTTTGEFDIFYNVSIQLKFDFRGTGSLRFVSFLFVILISISHYNIFELVVKPIIIS